MSGRTKEELDRIKSQQQNAKAAQKKKAKAVTKKKTAKATEKKEQKTKTVSENRGSRNAASRDEYDSRVRQSYGERNGLRLPSVFDEPRSLPSLSKNDQQKTLSNMRSRLESAEQSEKEKQSSAGDRFSVWNEDRRNPLTKTAVRTPERDVRAGNTGRTREELERRTATRDLAQTTSDDWLRLNRSAVALKDSEKAGVGLGTIRHGRMNENADLFTNNWSNIPKEAQVDASIQMIYSNGVNDRNRDMVMQAFNNATTYEKRKIMDAVVQTDGWSNVAYEMRNTINNAPDAEQALMQQISEDMNVRNGNYLDTFERAAGKAIVDQYNLQQKEDKVIADWAKENYDTGEALKYAVEQSVSGWLVNAYDAIALAHSDLMQAGQQDDITDGVGAPWRNVKNVQGFGNKVASVGTTVLHDLFRIAGLPISLLSKATYTPEEVNRITEKLMGVTDWYQEAVRNNQVALEASNLSEGQKTIAEITGTVIDQIPGIVMAVVGTPAAGMTTFGVQAGGKYGRSAYEQGASIEEAVKFGLSAAAAEVATEKLFTGFGYFGKGLSSKVLTDTTRKMLQNSDFENSVSANILRRVVAGGVEASEEVIMEIIRPYLERSTYNPAADGATMEEILRSGGLGFVVAEILGLPASALGVTGSVLEKADTRRQEQIIRSQIQDKITAAIERGDLSEQDAANINDQIKDIRSGKGTLTISGAQEEQKTTGENLDKVYSDFNEAREAMQAEAKGKADGETVTARFMQDGEAKLWTATVVDGAIAQVRKGFTSRSENAKYTAKAAKVAGATNTAERTGYQLNVKDEIVEQVSALSKAFGKEIEFINDNAAVHGYEQNGKIFVNANSSQSPAAAVIAHEMTHLLENTSSYKTLQGMMQNFYKSSLEDKRAEIFSNYKAAGVNLTDEQADYEVMAMFVEEKLLTDYDTIRELTRTDRTLAEKIKDWINKVIQKLAGSREQRFLIDARDMWNRALQEEKGNKKAPEDGADKRFSVSKEESKEDEVSFVSELEAWNSEDRPDGDTFILGSTGEVLQGLGAIESDIYIQSEKINTILREHSEMTLFEIKKIPRILNDPILILKSRNVGRKNKQNSRLVLFGSVKAQNGKPVLVAIDLKPIEKHLVITDMQKVTSAYSKTTNPVNFVKNSDFLYVDKNKKRAASLLRSIGFQMPIELQRVGSIGSISYKERSVNINGVPFNEVFNTSGKSYSIGRSEESEVQQEFTQEEKKDIKEKINKNKKEYDAEFRRRTRKAEAERKATKTSLSKAAKENEKGEKNNQKYRKSDKTLRKERQDAVLKEFFRNQEKPKPGSTKSMWLKNHSVQEITERFRRETLVQLINLGRFSVTNENIILDENEAEIAERKDDMWDFSEKRNTYTPYFGITLLAKKEGVDVDQFFTMYAKIREIKKRPPKEGEKTDRRKEVIDYITSLNLTANQKFFLYFDVAEYASSTMPHFLPGGRVNEKKGNLRGRMVESLDNIALDMFRGHMKKDSQWASENSPQIRQKDINDFVDLVFGKEDSLEKEEFLDRFTRMIADYSEQMEEARLIDKANLLVNNPKDADPLKVKIVRVYREAKQNFLCEGEAYERMADKLKNPLIRARYYQAKSAVSIANEMINGKHQRNLSGELMGKSLYQIFEPVFKSDTKAKNSNGITLLTELVNNRHDIYRQKYEKGYTGNAVEECEVIVENISKAHPELVKVADELVEYGRNLLKMCVECGRISQADYDYFVAKYPYYVPAYRLQETEMIDRSGKIKRDTAVFKKTRFGNRTVLPLWDQMVRRTNEMIKACKKNQLAYELVKSTKTKGHEDFVNAVTKSVDQGNTENSISDLGQIEDIGKASRTQEDDNLIPWYCNGEKYDVDIADASLLYGWDRINFKMDEKMYHRILRRMNGFRRAVLTQYNPTFWITNHIRDISDLFLYNQHAHRLTGYLGYAYAEMFGGKLTGTKAYQKTYKKLTGKDFEYDEKMADSLERYLSKGASQASIFEYENTNAGRKTTKNKVVAVPKKLFEIFDNWNFMFEQVPRLAVFNETVDRLTKQREKGKNDYTDEEIDTIAAYQAADATLNFGRSGTVVKNLNTYGCTFLNAGVQGMDRARRIFTQIKDGNKKIVFLNLFGLIFKIFIMGFSAHIIVDWLYKGTDEAAKAFREALYGDDEEKIMQEYAEMSDYQRMNYILINIGGYWIRIPQGRLASFIYSFGYNGEKVYEGEMDALDIVEAQWDMAKETVLFGNPVTNNIFGPIIDANLRNKDAWGNDIVSEYEDMGEGFHYLEYDEDTTFAAIKAAEFGHWLTADLLGEEESRILDISPKKLDYVIEQYFGSYANLLMPFLDGGSQWKDKLSEGLASTFLKKFYVIPEESNRLAGDYYDLKEKYENIANAHDGNSPYAVAAKLFNEDSEQLKFLRDQIKAINNDNTISNEERKKEVSKLRKQINELYRQGTAAAKNLLAFAQENYSEGDDVTELYETWVKENLSTEWRTAHFNKTEKKKYDKLIKAGCTEDTAVTIMDTLSDLEPLEGKTSVSDYQQVEAIAKLNLSSDQEEAAMSLALNEKGYAKYTSMTPYGVTAQAWLDFEDALAAADAANNNNGNYDKDEKQAALDSLSYSRSVKAVLWQSKDNYLSSQKYDTTWKAKRNPYDPTTASKMIDSYMEKIAGLDAEETEEEVQYLPLSADYKISSEYGVDRGDHSHSGIDLSVPEGSEVYSVMDGKVSFAGWKGGYGYRVVVDHPDGTQTAYSHLSDIGVKVGDEVEAGSTIALSGNTGNSTGPHLHFEVLEDGSYVDPEVYYDFGNGLRSDGGGTYVSQMSAVANGSSTRNYSSGGSSSSGGGNRSGSSGSGISSGGSRVASVSSNRGSGSGSGSSGSSGESGSSGGLSLPVVSRPAAVTGRSVESPTYSAMGLTLPRAGNSTPAQIQTSVATTQRTGRTGGSLWDPDVLG